MYIFNLFQLFVEFIQKVVGSGEACLLAILHAHFRFFQSLCDDRIVVESVSETCVYGFVHPVFVLMVTSRLEISVLLYKVHIFEDHIPDLLNAISVETGIAENLWHPTAFGHREEM